MASGAGHRDRRPGASPADAGLSVDEACLQHQEYQRQTCQHGAFHQHDQERDFHLRPPYEKQPDRSMASSQRFRPARSRKVSGSRCSLIRTCPLRALNFVNMKNPSKIMDVRCPEDTCPQSWPQFM